MKNNDIKTWDYNIIFDNSNEVFSKFNEHYSKNREMARYYIYRNSIQSTRIIVFIKDNVQIIKQERIKYGVSISLKRYKSSKEEIKLYFDTKNGSISKSKNGKFIPVKPSEIPQKIKGYIISQKKWMSFIFELNLPVTFSTIANKKLYSKRKLLSWFYNCNYKTALQINILSEERIYIRECSKNIRNLNNINPLFFTDSNYRKLFMEVLFLSIKTIKIVNAAWSFNRLQNELKLLNRHIIGVIYENTDDEELKIHDVYLPILKTLKDNGYEILNRKKEVIKCCKNENEFFSTENTNNYLFITKNKNLYFVTISKKYNTKDGFYFRTDNSYNYSNDLYNLLEMITKNYENLLLSYNRQNKIKKLNLYMEEENKEEYMDLEKETDWF